VYAENMPLQVLGVPLVPPRCGIWARRHHAEMTFMNELWFDFLSISSLRAIDQATQKSA